jgi:biotin carboxyl carrier protein
MARKIFISYRRDDSRYQARLIYAAFTQVIPPDHVFMDIASIPLGADFRKVLKGWVEQCDILLALIGSGWIDAVDPKTGQKRLTNPADFVRIEIGAALARDIPVVPVLLDGAPMPDAEALPDELKELIFRHAEFVEYRRFDDDVARLIKKLALDPNPAKPVQSTPTPARPGQGIANRIGDGRPAHLAKPALQPNPAKPVEFAPTPPRPGKGIADQTGVGRPDQQAATKEPSIKIVLIRVPTLGESVTEMTISNWFKKPGEAVELDEPLVELETEKVTIEVPAPVAGVLFEINAKQGDTVAVGALLGQIKQGEGVALAGGKCVS